jgi:hypothetical protein
MCICRARAGVQQYTKKLAALGFDVALRPVAAASLTPAT